LLGSVHQAGTSPEATSEPDLVRSEILGVGPDPFFYSTHYYSLGIDCSLICLGWALVFNNANGHSNP